jgi:hypothetical protein
MLGTAELWPCVLGFVALPALLQLALGGLLIESPRWHCARGSIDDAQVRATPRHASRRICKQLFLVWFSRRSRARRAAVDRRRARAVSAARALALPALARRHAIAMRHDARVRKLTRSVPVALTNPPHPPRARRPQATLTLLRDAGPADDTIIEELDVMLAAADARGSGKAGPGLRALVQQPTRWPLFISMCVMVLQQFSGINNVRPRARARRRRCCARHRSQPGAMLDTMCGRPMCRRRRPAPALLPARRGSARRRALAHARALRGIPLGRLSRRRAF